MQEVFTFNSYQLQSVIKRPASTDQPPNIRKRIIHSKISKKQYLLLQPNIQQYNPSSQNNVDGTTKKKVTFNLQNNSVFQPTSIQSHQLIVKKSKSLNQNQIIENDDMLSQKLNLNRHPLKDINNKPKTIEIGKKSHSIATNDKNKQMIVKREGAIKNRQHRIFSLKVNPKIVPISERKLPKAFKNNYVININHVKLEPPKKQLQQLLKQQKLFQYTKLSSQNLNKLKGISRLQKNLQIQQKIFDKLHFPKAS